MNAWIVRRTALLLVATSLACRGMSRLGIVSPAWAETGARDAFDIVISVYEIPQQDARRLAQVIPPPDVMNQGYVCGSEMEEASAMLEQTASKTEIYSRRLPCRDGIEMRDRGSQAARQVSVGVLPTIWQDRRSCAVTFEVLVSGGKAASEASKMGASVLVPRGKTVVALDEGTDVTPYRYAVKLAFPGVGASPAQGTRVSASSGVSAASADPRTQALARKLDAIVVPEVDFRQASLPDIVQFLAEQAQKHDAGKSGLNIALTSGGSTSLVTLRGSNMSLQEVLRAVADAAALSLDLEDDTVVLRKPSEARK